MSKENRNWDQIIEEWSKSGISATDFCKQQGLTRSNFYTQRSKRKYTHQSKTPPQNSKSKPVEFVDVTKSLSKVWKDKPTTLIDSPTLRLTSDSGVVVEVFL